MSSLTGSYWNCPLAQIQPFSIGIAGWPTWLPVVVVWSNCVLTCPTQSTTTTGMVLDWHTGKTLFIHTESLACSYWGNIENYTIIVAIKTGSSDIRPWFNTGTIMRWDSLSMIPVTTWLFIICAYCQTGLCLSAELASCTAEVCRQTCKVMAVLA